ncbi:hypothetical protein KIN20_024458 [Parelaphostrongylus tenuis]|uniref:Uncharacterized protein n=1 Tax=Parelaphostrongylus tenuis TaxID=148309 RepID=A0AAD5N871_PARTN|nr:hypothetical protein KIN20_024458 [Parelaphostrongylus tenuis]
MLGVAISDWKPSIVSENSWLTNGPNKQLHEDETVNLLKQLHNMENEIKDSIAQSPRESTELPSEMMNYMENIRQDNQQMGDTIEEINHNSKVDAALFQGDMILTKFVQL